jgi:ribose transport system substrate-binding protein
LVHVPRLAAAGACLSVLALGCGGAADADNASPPIAIAWMTNDGTNHSFFDGIQATAVQAGADLTATAGRQVTVKVMNPVDNKGASQVAQIEQAITDRVQAIDVDVNDATTVSPAIDKAVAAGIKVVTFDSDAPSSQRTTYYGIDNTKAGQTSAQLLTQLMGGTSGKIAVMLKENPPTSANFQQRLDGFTAELANHPGFTIAITVGCTDAVEVPQKAQCAGLLEDIMVSNPDVTGWYLARGRVLRDATLATDAPSWSQKMLSGAFKAVSFDAIPASNPQIKAGYANAVINQQYFGWGYDVVSLSYDIVANGRSVPSFFDSQFQVVCKENIDAVINMWTAADYRTPLPKCPLLP